MIVNWRIAIPPLLLALVIATYSGYQAWKAKADARRAVADAQSCGVKANHGDADAEHKLSSMYFYGRGVPQDYAQAAFWARKAADRGNARAEYDLGLLYHFGDGVPHDEAEALRWFGLSAVQRETRAEIAIGNDYSNGDGVPHDDAEAIRWYRLAADQGSAPAEDTLGLMYFRGTGVAKDNVEAVRWFRKAADQGYPYAEYDLATMLASGRGAPRDRSAAMRLFRQAAAHGDPAAQRYVTLSLTPWKRVVLVLVFLFSVWMLTEFFYDWPAHADDPQRRRFDVMLAVFWALNAALTGVNWYGYTHHKILCITCGMNAFTASRYILHILVLAGVITVLRTGKRFTAEEPSGPEAGPVSAPLSISS